jgi:MFS family permease
MSGPYLRFVGGQAVSVLGDQVWYVALSWSAVRLTSPAAAGAIMAVSALPRLAFLLLGGALVDRSDSRRLMIGSDLLRCAVALIAAVLASGRPGVALLVAVALVFGAADAVFLPAAATVAPRLLPPERLGPGAAVNLGITPMAIAVTGVTADRLGTVPAFAASAAMELIAAALCLAVGDLRSARLPAHRSEPRPAGAPA